MDKLLLSKLYDVACDYKIVCCKIEVYTKDDIRTLITHANDWFAFYYRLVSIIIPSLDEDPDCYVDISLMLQESGFPNEIVEDTFTFNKFGRWFSELCMSHTFITSRYKNGSRNDIRIIKVQRSEKLIDEI